MKEPESPFQARPGFEGVIVRFSDKRWYLREWHSHDALEINLVVRGSGSVLLEDRQYPLLPGHLLWLWPGQRHIPARWSSDMLLWIVEWTPTGLRRLLRARKAGPPRPGDPALFACRRLDAPALEQAQGVLSGAAAIRRPDTFNLGLNFALLMLWDLFTQAQEVESARFLHPKLEQALSLLNDPSNTMNLDQLARALRLSPSYLSVLFKEQTGLAIPDYRNRSRLSLFFSLYRAKPEIRLMELALEAGFGSYAQFFRVFTESVGQSPRTWLKALQP